MSLWVPGEGPVQRSPGDHQADIPAGPPGRAGRPDGGREEGRPGPRPPHTAGLRRAQGGHGGQGHGGEEDEEEPRESGH